MPKFAINLSMVFQEHPFLDRFEHAAASGFRYVEYLFPYDWDKNLIKDKLKEHNLNQILFNMPPGDWQGGERGIACLPGRKSDFKDGLDLAIEYASCLNVKKLHCMSGLTDGKYSPAKYHDTYLENVALAADTCEKHGIEVLIEPINSLIDMPGYFLDNLPLASEILKSLALPNLKVQFDIYHMQIIHGDLIRQLSSNIEQIGHIQFADNPGRHEPGTGEINLRNIFQHLDDIGYEGWVSGEYLPKGLSTDSFAWFRETN